ncbi:MAG TPA: hypothetical protein VHO25_12005 [Polyangiaceae bacterium]|nr:hypothetical protein [Polyangiaceae bacterium]
MLVIGCGGAAIDAEEAAGGGTAGVTGSPVGGSSGSGGSPGGVSGGGGAAGCRTTMPGGGGSIHFSPDSPPENGPCQPEGLEVCAQNGELGVGGNGVDTVSRCENGVWVRSGTTESCIGECNAGMGVMVGDCCDAPVYCDGPLIVGYCDGYRWRAP